MKNHLGHGATTVMFAHTAATPIVFDDGNTFFPCKFTHSSYLLVMISIMTKAITEYVVPV